MRRLLYTIVICLTILTSCDKVDFGKLESGKTYTGLYQGQDCIVLIDQVKEGNLKGRIYLDEGNIVASPIAFTSDLKKNGKGALWINSQKRKISNVTIDDDGIEGDVDEASFSLSLCQDSDLQYRAQYLEPCYEATVEPGRIYANNVEGYWSSYPDFGMSFGAIYAKKAFSLVTTKKLDLDMDLYYPLESFKEERRPLLMLIHGGAFYNGDKQDLGYPELGRHFAKRGYVVASINHRLGFKLMGADVDRAGYRALQDTHAAVCYLIKNADEFGIDTTRIFTAGTSAGAITALNLAFMRDENRPETTKSGGVLEWIITTFSRGLQLFKLGTGLMSIDLSISAKQICKLLGVDSDLGPINMVSDSLSRPFQIKAVVNMWGAVRSLDIIKNSPQTAILSFHGDSDRIVPYAYGHPFKNVLEPYIDTLFLSFPKLLQPVAHMGRTWLAKGKPFNEWAFNPIYGSFQIHKKALSLGLHSELITVKGGKHSLHQDNYKTLSCYFNDTIIPKMTHFLCEEMVGGKIVRLKQTGSWVEALDVDNVAELHWYVEGGAVLNTQGNNKVKVLLMGDAPHHSIVAGGKYKNGKEFRVEIHDLKE